MLDEEPIGGGKPNDLDEMPIGGSKNNFDEMPIGGNKGNLEERPLGGGAGIDEAPLGGGKSGGYNLDDLDKMAGAFADPNEMVVDMGPKKKKAPPARFAAKKP